MGLGSANRRVNIYKALASLAVALVAGGVMVWNAIIPLFQGANLDGDIHMRSFWLWAATFVLTMVMYILVSEKEDSWKPLAAIAGSQLVLLLFMPPETW